jgi:acetoin utilization deacetylase AcuC-like enzyme
MKVVFSEKCLEYKVLGHPESPERVLNVFNFLKEKEFKFIEAKPCEENDLLEVHSSEYVERIKSCNFFDEDTPALPNIYYYAKLSVGAAIQAMEISIKGEKSFSLMRPPGHHAGKNGIALNASSLGFCYFNNIAVATKISLKKVSRVAILDIDYHHGNGTQEIFFGNDRVLFVSLHAFPAYPYTGKFSEKNCLNYALPHSISEEEYLKVLEKALEEIERFNPELLAISVGFDTYKEDPIGGLNLNEDSYFKIGKMIAKLKIPLFVVLEGGYNVEKMPKCVYRFLIGLET